MVSKYTARLEGQRVLCIGGTSGIGYCVAEAALEQGAVVVIAGSNQDKVDAKVQKLQEAYLDATGRISGKACDIADVQQLESNLITLLNFATEDKQVLLDHIVITAGDGLYNPPLIELTLGTIQKAQVFRLILPLMVSKHAAAYLNQASTSSITITSGDGTYKPDRNWTLMPIFGGALDAAVRSFAVNLAPIRVNGVAPGPVLTERWNEGNELPEAKATGLSQAMGGKFLTGKLGRPEDVAEAYLHYIKNSNVTGQMQVVNGGKSLK